MAELKKATLGAGCFWCVEAVFQNLNGVEAVTSGYTGGNVKNPAYREVCNGTTGHAEVARISYDSSVVTFEEILEVFFATHDPTTLNRQGNDVGTQYRSEIFAHDKEQFEIAQKAIQAAEESGSWRSPIVTQVSMLGDFYPAEENHQNYYNENGEQGYCQFVVRPKVEKFKKLFADKLKA
jgi:peptide-methionine (S)-S-oxide reductase